MGFGTLGSSSGHTPFPSGPQSHRRSHLSTLMERSPMWLAWGARGEVAGSRKILSSMPICRVKNKVTGSGTWDVLCCLVGCSKRVKPFFCAINMLCLVALHVQLFVTPWTVAHWAPLSICFSSQEYQSGVLCPPPGDPSNLGIELRSPALQVDSLMSEPPGKHPVLLFLPKPNTLSLIMNN